MILYSAFMFYTIRRSHSYQYLHLHSSHLDWLLSASISLFSRSAAVFCVFGTICLEL